MTVDRSTLAVTAALTVAGKVGVSFAVYPDAYLPATSTPVTVTRSAPGSYTWNAALTGGKYAFSVYGPDGFLTSFAGTVVAAGVNSGPVPVVAAAQGAVRLKLTLANEGGKAVVYTLTPNDYAGSTQTVTVSGGGSTSVSWPVSADGYYDVVITADSGDAFRRRYAGRIG